MKDAYPIVLRPNEEGFYVIIPDFDIATQGNSIADAMEMARDAIGILGIDMQDNNEILPKPYSHEISKAKDDIITYVDVDFVEYRRKNEKRSIKKNCTIPYWLSVEADKENINYSRILQDALMQVLELKNKV